MRDHLHLRPGHAVDVSQEPRSDFGHDHDAPAVGRQVLDDPPRQRVRPGQERVERRDDRLAAFAHEAQHLDPQSPG